MSQTTSFPQPIVDYNSNPRPARSAWWLNMRMWIFVLVIALPVGYLTWVYVKEVTTQGIVHRSDGYTEVNLKAMSLFPFDQQAGTINDVPERFRALDGQKVIMVGEMWAPNAAGAEVNQFDLVYSIAKCCFSGPAQVQHFVKSTAKPGEGLPFYNGEVKVKGTLTVNVTNEAGKVASVYHLAVESIEPL